jgi:putative endopeptidase
VSPKILHSTHSSIDCHSFNFVALSTGENIADIGGLKVAYVAMQRYFAKNGRQKPEVLDGFTAEQRLFISWARVWRNNITEAFAKKLITVDVHSPGFARAMAVKNLPEFQEAFGVKEGHDMHLTDDLRADIW